MIEEKGTTTESSRQFFDNLTEDDLDLVHTFTFAAHHVKYGSVRPDDQDTRNADHVQLLNDIPEYYIEGSSELDYHRLLEYWISEVIQNGLDAEWGNNEKATKISIELDTERDSPSLQISHDGRPPQYIVGRKVPNEVLRMMVKGGTKRTELLLEGMFGIGFKIWYKLFNRIQLRAEYLQVEISTVDDNAPEFEISALENPIAGFEIEAIDIKEQFVETFRSMRNDTESLRNLLSRAIDGMILRPHPTEVTFHVNQEPLMTVTQIEQELSETVEQSGLRLWNSNRQSGTEDPLQGSLITFTKNIIDLSVAENMEVHLTNVLENTPGLNAVAEDIDDLMNEFQIHLSVDPKPSRERKAQNPLFCSMFPITRKGNQNMFHDQGLTFITHFGLDDNRKHLSTSNDPAMEKNRLLMVACLELLFKFLAKLSDSKIRTEIGISETRYIELLGFLASDGGNNRHAMDEFMDHISKLEYVIERGETQYVNYYPKICEHIFSIPFLPIADGNLLSYYIGIPLRPGLDKLLNHSEENIRKSTREQLIENEVVAYDEGRNMVPVEWWNRRHKENFKTSEQVISIIGDSYLDACVELFQKAVRN